MLSFDCTFNFWRLGALKTTLGWSFGIWLMKTHRNCVWTWLRTTYYMFHLFCCLMQIYQLNSYLFWTCIMFLTLPWWFGIGLIQSFSSKCLFFCSASFWFSHILSYTLYFGSPFSTALESFLIPYFIIFFSAVINLVVCTCISFWNTFQKVWLSYYSLQLPTLPTFSFQVPVFSLF